MGSDGAVGFCTVRRGVRGACASATSGVFEKSVAAPALDVEAACSPCVCWSLASICQCCCWPALLGGEGFEGVAPASVLPSLSTVLMEPAPGRWLPALRFRHRKKAAAPNNTSPARPPTTAPATAPALMVWSEEPLWSASSSPEAADALVDDGRPDSPDTSGPLWRTVAEAASGLVTCVVCCKSLKSRQCQDSSAASSHTLRGRTLHHDIVEHHIVASLCIALRPQAEVVHCVLSVVQQVGRKQRLEKKRVHG